MKRWFPAIVSLFLALPLFAAPRSWKQLAEDAISQHDYNTAAVYYRKWMEADPTDATSLYNLSCCEAVLRRPEEAMHALTMASEAGWNDSVYTMQDSDLACLHERDDFKALLSQMARHVKSRYGGYVHDICPQERLGDYLIVLPEAYDSTVRYPLIILLHGLGASPEEFAEVGAFINKHDYIYAVPRGPYTARDTDGKGFSHFRERDDPSDTLRGVTAAADWVVRVADDVAKHYPVADTTFWLVGFSQGAGLAHLVAAYYPTRVAGYCAHAGFFVKGAISSDQLAAEARAGVRVLLTHGKDDPNVPLAEGINAFNQLKQAGVDVTMEQMDILHHFPPEVGAKVANWLKMKMEKSAIKK
jgi:phospholipase/carboxylesterase